MKTILMIFLLLLKILGITILAILGFLLFLLLMVLFVPIRYRGHYKKDETTGKFGNGEGGISWALFVLRVRLRYDGSGLCTVLRIFGFKLYDSTKEPKHKKEKKKSKKEKKQKEDAEDKQSEDNPTVEAAEAAEKDDATDAKAPAAVETKSTEDVQTADTEGEPAGEANTSNEGKKKKKPHRKRKEKIAATVQKVKNKITSLVKKIKLLFQKKEALTSFLENEENKKVIGSGVKTVKKVLHHILPRKLKGSVTFGTGAPAGTGKAFAAAAFFYALYGDHVTLTPDFEEKKLLGELEFKGHIRIFTVLWLLLRFWWKKETKKFRKRLKRLQRQLKRKAE